MSEVADTIALVRDRVPTPLVVDADNGYGNALNVQRTVRIFERAGATAIQLEDQSFPKRCGHLQDKSIIPAAEMAGKIQAAVDARASEETIIIARTDAVAVEGIRGGHRARGSMPRRAPTCSSWRRRNPASSLLPSRLRSDPCARFSPIWSREGIRPCPPLRISEVSDFRLVIFPGGIVRALARTAQDYYRSLHAHGTNEPFRERMFDFAALNRLIGTPEMLALGERYENFDQEAAE